MTDHIKPVHPRDKTAAILLAVFLGFWTWLYTYEKSKKKFWIALISIISSILVLVILIILSAITQVQTDADALRRSVNLFSILMAFLITLLYLGITLWAIVDVASKPAAWYQQYPNELQ